MQFRFRTNQSPARRAPGRRSARRSSGAGARRLRLEPLETRTLLAVTPLIGGTTQARVLVPTLADYDDLGLDWTGTAEPFPDAAWPQTPGAGPNGVGYNALTAAYDPYIGENIQTSMQGNSRTAFVRIPFSATDVGGFDGLTLKMRFDDGFIAYLNGTEIQRANVNPALAFPPYTTGSSGPAAAGAAFTTFDVTSQLNLLNEGTNVLAIRGFNFTLSNTTFLVQAALDANRPDTVTVANDDAVAFRTDQAAPVINVLANDVAGSAAIDPRTVEVVSQANGGTTTVNATTGAITYTPNAGFAGTDTFTYRVRDTANVPTPGGGTQPVTVVAPATAPHRTFVPTNDTLALTWTGGNEPFNDAAWVAGVGGIGYDPTGAPVDFAPFINDNVQVRVSGINPGIYERIPFTADPATTSGLRLRLRYDDGFIAYINGVKVAENFAPATPLYNSLATGQNGDTAALVQQEFIVPMTSVNLRSGANANVLAIHLLNQAIGSSDILMQAELIADVSTKGLWSNEATVTVSVTGPGPVAAPDSGFTQVATPVTIPVLANDVPGFSGAAIVRDTVAVTVPPANGTTQVDLATGDITYTPDPGFSGDDVFTYQVRDNAPIGGTQTSIILPRSSPNWRYLDTGMDPGGTTWQTAGFNDSAWLVGTAQLGYGDIQTTTTAVVYPTTLFRKTITLTSADVVELKVRLLRDDGAAVYINGVEIRRDNLPMNAAFTDFANAGAVGGAEEEQYIETTLTAADLQMRGVTFIIGDNIIAADVHQDNATSSDIGFDVELEATFSAPSGNVSNPAEVHVHVNAPPVAVNDTIAVGPQGTTGTVPNSITFNPLANDSDPDNSPSTPAGSTGLDPRTVVITQQPPPFKGTVSVNPNTGFITYTATGLSTPQIVTFRYTVRDYEGAVSLPATVTANVVVVAPQVMDDTAVTAENTPVVIDVLANDAKGDLTLNLGSVTLDLLAPPSNGTVSVNSTTGRITYTPNAGFRDQFDSFGYTLSDISGNRSNTATVSVDVFSRAIAREDGFALNQGDLTVTIPIADMLANDYFPSSFQPEVVIVPNSWTKGLPPVINRVGGVQQSITFTPTAGATGVAGFSYYLADVVPNPTRPNSNNARVNIALGAVNVSGIVYVDVNRNNVYDAGEQLVPDATIVLTRAGDPAFRRTTMTNSLGAYSFASTSAGVLPPDTYTITQIQPSLYLDFTAGVVNSYTAALTARDNPGYDFREWTVNPQFFTMLANYGGGFLASQQPVSLSANSLVVPYDLGWNGAFTAKATYDPALGSVSVKLYNSAGSVVANSATNPSSTPGNSVINYSASASQPLVLVVSGTNPNVSIESPSLGTSAGDTTPPFVFNTSLSSSMWSPAFVDNLTAHHMGAAGYNVAAGETLPWRNLDRVSIRFTEPVTVGHNDLRLWGVAVEDYPQEVGIQSFSYDPFTFTATWTLTQPIAADQLRVSVSDAVRDTWGNRVGGTIGYERLFNVLSGGTASLGDVLARQFSSIGTERYSPYYDLDGNGTINFVDAIHMRNAAGTALPIGTPGDGTTSTPSPQAPAAVVVSATRDIGLDAGASTRRSTPSVTRTATAQRLIARGTRAAATDAALGTSTDVENSSGATSSLTALRARRAARTVDRALNSLGGTL